MNRVRLSDYKLDIADLFHYEKLRLQFERNAIRYLSYNFCKVFCKKKFRKYIETSREAEGVNEFNLINDDNYRLFLQTVGPKLRRNYLK